MSATPRKRFLFTLELYTEAFHEGVLTYCLEQGHEVVHLRDDNLDEVSTERHDGVVGGLPSDISHPIFKYISASSTPVVEYSFAKNDRTRWCRIPLDAALCGRMAADYLLRRPVAGFAYVCKTYGSTGSLRQQHFHAFLKPGLNGRPYAKFPGRESGVHEERLEDFLLSLPRPCGIFTSTDSVAADVCATAARIGLRVPQDLYVIGNGNREIITRLAPVPITCIDIDYRTWGYAAARMLDEFTSGKIPEGTVRTFAPSGVIERESTGGEAGGDPLTRRAIDLMRRNMRVPLNLPDIAERLGISPATLKRAFASSLGEGVSEHYLRLRIENAKGLLISGEKVESVAHESGFASTGSFRKAFVKITGVTPGSFDTAHSHGGRN